MNAYLYCMRHYAGFSGRASRSEYWIFALIFMLIYGVLYALDYALFGIGPTGIGFVSSIVYLIHLVPALAVLIRRLHDVDRSGWWLLISFVPLIGGIWLLVLLCMRGSWGPNRFGPGPELVDTPHPAAFQG